MFRYENNNKLAKPGESPRTIITKVRKVTYVNRNPNLKKEKVTEGFEIVEERVVSPDFKAPESPQVVGHKTVTYSPRLKKKKEAYEQLPTTS